MNYAVKDIEMVPGRRGGICLCVNTVREAMYRYIFQAKKKNQPQKKNQTQNQWTDFFVESEGKQKNSEKNKTLTKCNL